MNEFIERILAMSPGEVLTLVGSVMRNPGSNPTAFALVLAAVTVVLLLVILALIMFLSSEQDESEIDEAEAAASDTDIGFADLDTAVAPVPVPIAPPEPIDEGERLGASRSKRIGSTIIWGALFLAVWVFAGAMTRVDSVCLSCHTPPGIHFAHSMEGVDDPHGGVACVSCHETSNVAASFTTAVPARIFHFAFGSIDSDWSRGYDPIVTNRSCLGCHERDVRETIVNEVRGIRTSHKEPLEASARCTDCHSPHLSTGIVDRFTVGMDPCIRCHDGEAAPSECSYCHTKDRGFISGSENPPEPRSHASIIRCDGCHTEADGCDACHGTKMPHTDLFKAMGHAREATEDLWYNNGQGCKKCHSDTRNPCFRCHRAPFPGHPAADMIESHKRVDPFNNSCDTCHGPQAIILGRNFCGNCHERWAASPAAPGPSSTIPGRR